MISFENTTVIEFARNCLKSQWSIVALDEEDLTTFDFSLHRSQSENASFETAYIFTSDQTEFYDRSVNTLHAGRRYFYKIKAVSTVDPAIVFESEVFHVACVADCVALEIVRKERLYLRQYIKKKAYIYSITTEGNRCSECWNPITGERSKRNCSACNDTGFEVGVLGPFPVYISISPEPRILRSTGIGPQTPSSTAAWTSNNPYLKNNDFIKEVITGSVWRVVDVACTELNGYAIKQNLTLTLVEKGSIMYDLHIPEEWIEPWPAEDLTGVPHDE